MDKDLEFILKKPDPELEPYVESFWSLYNNSGEDKSLVILPDGRVDLTFSKSDSEPFHIVLSGIETHADTAVMKAGTRMFAISFKLSAAEWNNR